MDKQLTEFWIGIAMCKLLRYFPIVPFVAYFTMVIIMAHVYVHRQSFEAGIKAFWN